MKDPNFNFLVIDHDPVIAGFLENFLHQKGHTCQIATDSSQAIDWLQTNDYEVILMDLRMPKVEKISLVSHLREARPQTPIIVFTGIGYDHMDMNEALRAGANGYVSKDLRIPHLYSILSRMLSISRQ